MLPVYIVGKVLSNNWIAFLKHRLQAMDALLASAEMHHHALVKQNIHAYQFKHEATGVSPIYWPGSIYRLEEVVGPKLLVLYQMHCVIIKLMVKCNNRV